jgi:hypothetical protein
VNSSDPWTSAENDASARGQALDVVLQAVDPQDFEP